MAPEGRAELPHLLHVAQHVLPAVEHAFALLRVQLVDEVGGVVLTAALVPDTQGAWGSGPRPQRPPQPHATVFSIKGSGLVKEVTWKSLFKRTTRKKEFQEATLQLSKCMRVFHTQQSLCFLGPALLRVRVLADTGAGWG